MALKVVNAWWSNSPDGVVGLVVAENEMGFRKLRISKITPSGDEDGDATMVADMGGKLSLVALEEIITSLKKGKSYE